MWLSNSLATMLMMLVTCQCVVSVPVNAKNKTIDDLTTDFAKKVISRSKMLEIKAMLNTKADPCTDFYAYSCGNWHRNNPAQLFKNIMTDNFQAIAKGFDRRLENLLVGPPKDDLKSKLQRFYQACKLVHRDDVHYKLALENVYKEFGELPVLAGEAWKESDFNWWQWIANIQHKYGKQIVFAVDIMGDLKNNNTENKVYVGAPEFTQSTGSKILGALEVASAALDFEKYFGVEHQLAMKTVKEMAELEKALVKGSSATHDVGFQEFLELQTINELNDEYGENIDFNRFLEIVLGETPPESVYIYDEEYLKNTLATIQKTPKNVVANYILWQLLHEYFVEAAVDDIPEWCVEKTKKYFGKYIDNVVYESYKSEQVEAEVYQVWQEIRNTYRDQLRGDKFDWISNKTRTKAIDKLEAMQLHINSYDGEDFNEIYANLSLDRTNYVYNVQQIQKLERQRQLAKLNGPPTTIESPEILSFTPAYNILENIIKIPVAMLQPFYLWNTNYPQALKYGTLGYLIAHEMIHGFDDDGRNYDKNGRSDNWWDAKSTYEYEERRKCFTAQYHNYKYGGTKLPEAVLQSENIADNAGVKLAYEAYKRWLEQQEATNPDIEQQETFADLELDNRQLFFAAFAQLWCEDVQTYFKTSFAAADTHAPGMYRVIGSLSNFQEFSWVFKCKKDAAMDPEFKCAIY